MKTYHLFFFILLAGLWSVLACAPSTREAEEKVAAETEETGDWLVFKGDNAGAKKIVLVSGDEEYRSEEALPQLAKILSERHGFDCTVLFSQDPEHPGVIDPNYLHNIPGLPALEEADLMIVFTRFRDLPDEQMQPIHDYLKAGKPVIGIRTATHAFNVKDTTGNWYHWGNYYDDEEDPWSGGFGRLVLGEKWISHHGHHKQQSTRGLIAAGAEDHPVTSGLSDGDIWGPTDVYGVRLPLPGDTQPLIMGQVVDREGEFDESDPFFGLQPSDAKVADANPGSNKDYNPNDPMMPVAWIKTYQIPEGQPGKAFTSTIGSSTDMTNEGVRRLFVNAAYHLLGLTVPERADVTIVGEYKPTAYSFHEDEYWDQKNLKIEALAGE